MGRPAAASVRPASSRTGGWSIRTKLLLMVLLPLLGVLPLLGAGLLWWASLAIDQLLLTKVRSDLAVAQGYFERVQAEVASSTTGIAESAALVQALDSARGDPVAAPVNSVLDRLAKREKLDFIRLLPAAMAAAERPESTSVEVLPPQDQQMLRPELRAQVAVALVPTRSAAPTARTTEDRALVLQATRAVRDPAGRLLGHLQAGVLLNRNLALIDHINEIVYPQGSLPFSQWGSRGTVTLFLDDVRISTNVRLFGAERDQRAIGTRVSQTVRESVLGQGITWLDRAFVVSDWYVSAYQPLRDGAGRRVGMLYVGVLERPFTLVKYLALLSVGVLFLAVMVAAALLSVRWARSIFKPLEQMEATMQRVGEGVLEARVGELPNHDEVGRLAGHLDQLLATIQAHTQNLDAQVAERTQALELAQQQLVHSEKMATVGQLTASIAHEINNPIAVIQGNMDLMRELMGPVAAARTAAELKLVDDQVERMRLIVTKLLQYARPGEYAGYVEAVDPVQALEDCIVLASHQIQRAAITITRDHRATRQPQMNRQELQQVLVNLIVNAMHAMPGGGHLRLATLDEGDDAVVLEVTDSGSGLSEELLGRLFQPFVTRRPDGTGLGLWISRSLVERYGGKLRAANRQDGQTGAVFTVVLKCSAAA